MSTEAIEQVVRFVAIIFVAGVISFVVERMVRRWLQRMKSPVAASGVAKFSIRILIYGIGLLVALGELGIQIGPILTALGVGGLAAALALKDTLENLFSGISLIMERSIKAGNRVKLEVGLEGIIKDIGWRSSQLVMDNGDTIIIPNSKLIQGINVRKV